MLCGIDLCVLPGKVGVESLDAGHVLGNAGRVPGSVGDCYEGST